MKDYSRKVALEVVTALEREFDGLRDWWDSDHAWKVADLHIPMAIAEAQEWTEELDHRLKATRPRGPSLMQQLRTALGVHKDAGLRTTLELAIAAINNGKERKLASMETCEDKKVVCIRCGALVYEDELVADSVCEDCDNQMQA